MPWSPLATKVFHWYCCLGALILVSSWCSFNLAFIFNFIFITEGVPASQYYDAESSFMATGGGGFSSMHHLCNWYRNRTSAFSSLTVLPRSDSHDHRLPFCATELNQLKTTAVASLLTVLVILSLVAICGSVCFAFMAWVDARSPRMQSATLIISRSALFSLMVICATVVGNPSWWQLNDDSLPPSPVVPLYWISLITNGLLCWFEGCVVVLILLHHDVNGTTIDL